MLANGGRYVTSAWVLGNPSGAAGTIYRETASEGAGWGTILVDGLNVSSYKSDVYTELPSGTTLYLNGYTLTLRSLTHLDRKGWSGKVDEDNGGTIVWRPGGTLIMFK